jgi:hypothetical protein
MAYGGGIDDLPGYVRMSMLDAGGYTSHVSLPGALVDLGLGPWPTAHFVATSAALMANAMLLAGWAQPTLFPIILIVAFPLFATYKSAVVRCALTHWIPATLTAVSLLSVFVVRVTSMRVAAGSVAVALAATTFLVNALTSPSFIDRLVGAPTAVWLTAKWAASGDFRRALFESDIEGIVQPHPAYGPEMAYEWRKAARSK